MSEVKKIYAAIQAIANGLRQQGIAKSATCQGGGNFRYRGIDSVYAALSPLLNEHNVIIRPVSIVRDEDVQAGKMRLVRIHVTYQAVCTTDGSSIEFQSLGEGCDTSDKAAGKAMSYAYKSAMFQVFCIPVEGQEDPDQVVHQVEQEFLPVAVVGRCEELLDAIPSMDTLEELNALGAEIKKLNLPRTSTEYKRLAAAFGSRSKELKQQ